MKTAQALAEAGRDARIRRCLDGKRPMRGAEAPKAEAPLRACAQAAFATAVRIGCRHPRTALLQAFLKPSLTGASWTCQVWRCAASANDGSYPGDVDLPSKLRDAQGLVVLGREEPLGPPPSAHRLTFARPFR